MNEMSPSSGEWGRRVSAEVFEVFLDEAPGLRAGGLKNEEGGAPAARRPHRSARAPRRPATTRAR